MSDETNDGASSSGASSPTPTTPPRSTAPSAGRSAPSSPPPIRVSKQKRPEGRVTTLRGLLDATMRTHIRRLRGEL